MQLTVFGASGRVGQQVVAIALERGYTVQAFIHSHRPFKDHERLHVTQGDIGDATAVREALQGSEAVISVLGSWKTKEKTVVSDGSTVIIPAMEELGIRRLVTVTGAAASWSHDTPTILNKLWRLLFSLIRRDILRDGDLHLTLLEQSRLNWTCLRSPAMTRRKAGKYVLDNRLASLFATIPRSTVAHALVDQLSDAHHLKQAPTIHKR